MPQRKKLPEISKITDIGCNPETHIVQKSNPLLTLSETGLTLAEFKILDAYLARINSHKPEERFVRLEKGAIERYLGVTQIKPADLEKRIDNLFQTITIRDESEPSGFVKIALFEKAACYQDDDGLWQIELGASASAMEYIFNVENLGYLRYRLKNIVNLTSRYSYVLYLYLEQNRRMHLSWEINLEQLKTMLRCTADTYRQYYRFNELVLKKCHKELSQKTDCQFSYDPVKKGRSVVAVRFTLESKVEVIGDACPDGQMTLEDWIPVSTEADQAETELWRSALPDSGFTDAQLNQIRTLLLTVPEDKLPDMGNGAEINRFHYIQQQWARLLVADQRNQIKNKCAYLCKIIEQDAN